MDEVTLEQLIKDHEHFIFCGVTNDGQNEIAMKGYTSELAADIHGAIQELCERNGGLTPAEFVELIKKVIEKNTHANCH